MTRIRQVDCAGLGVGRNHPWSLLERVGFAQKAPTPVYEESSARVERGNTSIGGREGATASGGDAPARRSEMVARG
jgi:hypothetical protein